MVEKEKDDENKAEMEGAEEVGKQKKFLQNNRKI
jgi:hypothetical protein